MDLFEEPDERPRSDTRDDNATLPGTSHLTAARPLADRMRPRDFEEFYGQPELTNPDALLRRLVESDQLRSVIFWGPPGCGKTTLANILARRTRSRFLALSAVTASIKDAKAIMEGARQAYRHEGKRTLLFVDEIHRFNKAQQDAFLPFVEDGSIVLVGATTENPSFSVVPALLSRCRVFTLRAHDSDSLMALLRRALDDTERGLGATGLDADEAVLRRMAELSDGDARRALNLLELAVALSTAGAPATATDEPAQDAVPVRRHLDDDVLAKALQREHLLYDKDGESHFNLISALHKSLRSSDVQAALYWTQRMLQSGDDPRYVSRRLVRFASEDIGNADPQALMVAMSARAAFDALGQPEGDLALLQCAAYLATAPKSNAIYVAQKRLQAEIEATGALPVPLHLRNAPTGLMKSLGYGANYQYDHDSADGFSGQRCLPDDARTEDFYEPKEVGFEREIKKRMDYWAKLREGKRGES